MPLQVESTQRANRGAGEAWTVPFLHGDVFPATGSKDNHIGIQLKGDSTAIPGIGGHARCESCNGDDAASQKVVRDPSGQYTQ